MLINDNINSEKEKKEQLTDSTEKLEKEIEELVQEKIKL